MLVWEDDPESEGALPVAAPIPGDSQSRFQLNIIEPTPPPAQYPPGSPEFRYWTARAALVRCRDFWEPLLPEDAAWQTGLHLPVTLDAGIRLNAFYHRASGLAFYHDKEAGREIYVGESADIICHELGHAILDALQGALWLAATFETAAFHEAFGDISALLAGLQLDSFCAYVLGRHGGWIERDSRWTRVGEALGKALHQRDPGRGSTICLRNAANAFFYQPPNQLPASGPDSQLTREPHSLARIFVGGFVDALGGMVRADSASPTIASVQETAMQTAAWLAAAIRHAPVQKDYFFQVASALTAQAATAGEEERRNLIASAFVRRGILPVEALDGRWPLNPKTLDRGENTSSNPIVPPVAGFAAAAAPVASPATFDGALFGLRTKALHLPVTEKKPGLPLSRVFVDGMHRSMMAPFAAAGGVWEEAMLAPALLEATPTSAPPIEHEESFIHYLFQRGRVEFTPRTVQLAATGPMFARKTHRLAMEDGRLTLERIGFDCGFD